HVPYTTLFRSHVLRNQRRLYREHERAEHDGEDDVAPGPPQAREREGHHRKAGNRAEEHDDSDEDAVAVRPEEVPLGYQLRVIGPLRVLWHEGELRLLHLLYRLEGCASHPCPGVEEDDRCTDDHRGQEEDSYTPLHP